jgi:hypothetical protein
VDVDARPQLRSQTLLSSAFHDLGDSEVIALGMLAVKQGRHDPHLIGHLQLMPWFSSIHDYKDSMNNSKIKG